MSRVLNCLLFVPFFFVLFLSSASAGLTEKQELKLRRLVENGGYLVTKNGKPILAHNPDTLFIPASTWKIATSLAALHILGPEFRFTTEIYQDNDGNLYIKGFGDPFLISEEISVIIARLKENQVSKINNIYLDDSTFAVNSTPEGAGDTLNPYDVANGALAVNFNTVNLTVSPQGLITSAEPQTPTLPLMQKLGRTLKPGTHRINICLDNENILRHTGQLFRAMQGQAGIPGHGIIAKKIAPRELTPIYTHHSSKSLPQVIAGLLLYSNNFITNQLFLTLGAHQYGYPATWEKGRMALETFLMGNPGHTKKNVMVAEGSGLSRNNHITPRALLSLLEQFKPHADLLPMEKGRRIKSGTLTDVFCYAGYFRNGASLDSFVLILNQPGNHRDQVINILEDIYRKAD